MIVCPNCHHKELAGALFCSECGNQLVTLEGAPTQLISEPTGLFPEKKKEEVYQDSNHLIGAFISLHLLELGQILPLYGHKEYTIGRAADDQNVRPDIDLTPYKGYEKGVSRLHAMIQINGLLITIKDLGSVNGTRLNGRKLNPNEAYNLSHGDILSLGKLRVQVIIRQ